MIYCVYKIDVKWNESKSKIESQIHERKKNLKFEKFKTQNWKSQTKVGCTNSTKHQYKKPMQWCQHSKHLSIKHFICSMDFRDIFVFRKKSSQKSHDKMYRN